MDELFSSLGPKLPDLRSDEERVEAVLTHPLFMTSMKDLKGEDEGIVDAIQSLLFDGTPEEMAENFKVQALTFNPNNIKAYYRSVKALLALDKMEEGIDCCQRGLRLDPTNLNFKNDLIRLEKRSVQLEQLSILAGIKREASEKKALGLATAKSSRQYRFYDHIPNEEEDDEKHVPVQHPDAAPYRIQLLQDGELTFPVIFLYPESNQSDVIEEFRETDTFYSHFTEMFAANAAWDPQHLYHVDTLDWYFETHVEKYAKVGQELVSCLKSVEASNAPSQNAAHKYVYLTLGDMLRNDKCTIIDGIVQIIVLSRTSSEFSLKYRKEYRKLRN